VGERACEWVVVLVLVLVLGKTESPQEETMT